MAKEKRIPLLFSLLLLLPSSLSISETSLNAAITSLRSNSYTLFGNAILTSDLYTDLLSNATASFTLFAPKDPSLSSLDISTRANLYVSLLRRHVAIGRLHSLTPPLPDSLSSLLPDHPVFLYLINGSGIVTANNVVIIAPRIFDGPDFTVHGLAGMLPVIYEYPAFITTTLSSAPTITHTSLRKPSSTNFPTSTSQLSSRVVDAPMAQFARLCLDEVSPSPNELTNEKQGQLCLIEGCSKVSSAFDRADPSPTVTGPHKCALDLPSGVPSLPSTVVQEVSSLQLKPNSSPRL
jgi:hypothetical protein